jgi:hypothetical protein
MKSYIFNLGNSNNTTSYSSNSGVSSYTQSLFDKALDFTPYWSKTSNGYTPFRSTYESKAPIFTLPFTLEKKSPLFDPNFKYKKIQKDLDAYEAWTAAMNKMKAYRNYYGDRSYDALVGGIPANFFGDFVQIGDVVIPTYANRDYFNRLPRENKLTIVSVSITILNIFVIE